MGERTNRARPGLAALLAALLLAACAQPPRQGPPPAGYQPGDSYHLVMAEIAIQRKQYMTAAQEYLTAAEQSRDPATARRATEFAFDYGYDRFALRSAARWVKLAPDSTSAHEYLGRLSLRRYDLDEAVRHYALALGPADQRSGDDYLALQSELAEERNTTGVLRLLQRLHSGGPRQAGYRLAIARAAYAAGHDELALGYAARLANENNFEAQLLLGRVLLAQGKADQALAYIGALARQQPVLGLELEYVRLLAASRRETAALEILERMIAHYGREPALLRLRALINMGLGELEAAQRDLDETAAAGKDVYESYYYLGEIESERGQYDEAIRHFSRIGAGAHLLDAQMRIAEARLAMGDEAAALDHLAQFARDYPRYGYDMLERRAALLQRLGRNAEALDVYAQMMRIKPPSPGLLVTRGILLDRLGQRKAAIRSMSEAVKIAPDDADALNSLGYTLALDGHAPKRAWGMVREAVSLAPDSAAILDSMGWLEYLRGNTDAARSWLQSAYKRLRDPEIAAHLGEVLYTSGDTGAARRIWQEALIDHPNNKPLRDTVERFRQ